MTSPSWGGKPARDAGRAKATEEARRGKALRPRHVIGDVGERKWFESQDSAFREQMQRMHPERVHAPQPVDESDPHCVPQAWRAPIGNMSSLE